MKGRLQSMCKPLELYCVHTVPLLEQCHDLCTGCLRPVMTWLHSVYDKNC